MKKALVVLLILAIAGGVFAQELTWSGAVKTGLEIVANDEHNGEEIATRFNNDDVGDEALRLQLDGAYTKDNYGVKFGVRGDAIGGNLGVGVYNAYGWITFVNEIIKVSAGLIDDGVWKTAGVGDYGISGTGVRFEIAPITGLSLGFMLRAPDKNLAPNFKQFLSETAFGAKYESDLFWVAGGLIIDSTADNLSSKNTGSDGYKWERDATAPGQDSDHGLVIQAGFGVKPISGLTVSVDGIGTNASKFNEYGQFRLDEKVSYMLMDDKLEVGLKARQEFYAKDGTKGYKTEYLRQQLTFDEDYAALNDVGNHSLKPYINFVPYVGYDVFDALNVGLEVKFGLFKDVWDYELGIKPKASYKVGDGATISAFYNFEVWDFYGDATKTGARDDRKTDKSNTIQIDMIWTF
jgi:hypothetical protein